VGDDPSRPPVPGGDKRNLVARAAGFAGFSLLAAWAGLAPAVGSGASTP
jgi:hypothetical protein